MEIEKELVEVVKQLKNPYPYEDIYVIAQRVWDRTKSLMDQQVRSNKPFTRGQQAVVDDMYKLSQAYLNIFNEYKELKTFKEKHDAL